MKKITEYIIKEKLSLNNFITEADDDLDGLLGGDDNDGSSGDSGDSGDDKDKDSNDDTSDKKDDKTDDSGDASLGTKGKKDDEKKKERGDIKFTIWEAPDKQVRWLKDNQSYQKIEYKYEDPDKEIHIDFLLGYQDNSWKLWIGKIGACSYDDDYYYDFKTDKFSEGMVACLDKVQEFLDKVRDDPQNYVQFYLNR